MEKKKKREIIEWVILIVIIGIIYLGGWQTQVIGKLQQAVLATGIISPDEVNGEIYASYDFQLKDIENAKELYQQFLVDFPGSMYVAEARKRFRKLRGDFLN